MTPSDLSGILTRSQGLSTLRVSQTAEVRPQEVTLELIRPQGRPTDVERDRRHAHMLRLLTEGYGWRQAARIAHVKPDTVLGLLDRPDFAPVAVAILERVA